MGAELISAVIEIAKGVEPNWLAAQEHIKSMPDVEAANLHSEILQLGDEYTAEDLNQAGKISIDFLTRCICEIVLFFWQQVKAGAIM